MNEIKLYKLFIINLLPTAQVDKTKKNKKIKLAYPQQHQSKHVIYHNPMVPVNFLFVYPVRKQKLGPPSTVGESP